MSLISFIALSSSNLKASQSKIAQEKLFFLRLEANNNAHVGGSMAEK